MNQYISLEAEQAVLGCILKSPELIFECSLQEFEFYNPQHAALIKTMLQLRDKSIQIDPVAIVKEIGEGIGNIGGNEYLLRLTNSVSTVANFNYYCSIVHDKYVMRKAITSLNAVIEDGKTADSPEQLIASIQQAGADLAEESNQERGFRSLADVLDGHEEELLTRSTKKGLTGVKTVSRELDKLSGGHQNQDLIILAARPSVGKTAFMLNDAKNAAESGTVDAVGIISLEMPDKPIAERIVSASTHIDSTKIRTGMLNDEDWGRYTMGRQLLSDLPIYIDDSPGITVQQIRSKVRAFKRRFGRIIIYIDYLQLISGGKSFPNTQEEIRFISKQLKQIAKENDCPIIAISSLGRGVEQRQDKRPMMSDLRDSGQIEFDADIIMFLYRDDYYNADSEKKNIVEVIIAKGRNIGTGIIEMVYMKNFNKFVDFDYQHTHTEPGADQLRQWA